MVLVLENQNHRIQTLHLSQIIEYGGQVDVIFTNLKKAFVIVDHNLLIIELNSFDVGNLLLTWLSLLLISLFNR